MSGWFQKAVWAAGIFVIFCPTSLCLYNFSSWWVCICAMSLISVMFGTGYTTWKTFVDILHKGPHTFPVLARGIDLLNRIVGEGSHRKLSGKIFLEQFPHEVRPNNTHLSSLLVSEISSISDSIYKQMVLPWYVQISPEQQISFEIKDAIEELLLALVSKLQTTVKANEFISNLSELYVRHFRQYSKALKKVAITQEVSDIYLCIGHPDISMYYQPIHPALSSSSPSKANYIMQLSQNLLVQHLPPNILQCELFFTLIRDVFAQNILSVFTDKLCNKIWLNDMLSELIFSFSGEENCEKLQNKTISEYNNAEDLILRCVPLKTDTIFEQHSPHEQPEKIKKIVKKDCSQKDSSSDTCVSYVKCNTLECACEGKPVKSVSLALGGFITTVAVPLLPKLNTHEKNFNVFALTSKMWESPVEEKNFSIDMQPIKKKNPFVQSVVEGLTLDEYKSLCTFSGLSKENILKDSSYKLLFTKPRHCMKKNLERSKSCDNLLCIDNSLITVNYCSKSLRDLSNKEINMAYKDLPLKHRKHLVKMLSFDDEQSIDSSMHLLSSNDTNKKEIFSNFDMPDIKKSFDSFISKSKLKLRAKKSVENIGPEKAKDTNSTPPNSLDIPKTGSPVLVPDNPDLSPIYEESDNLAATIEKLRSLISERETQNSLGSLSSFGSSESEPKSAQSDPGRYNFEKSKFTFAHKDSSGSLASIKSVSSIESCSTSQIDELPETVSIPFDGCVFLSISIPTTAVDMDKSGNQFTVYTIQYDAVYVCESNCEDENVCISANETKMILQTNSIKRRFREFLSLHSSLEDSIHLKQAIKGVKGPNKWLNLPFSKLDSSTIASRRLFLEKYLQTLIQKPEINTSVPLKEFLAYGIDSSVTFVKKPQELSMSRIDKILAKTVTDVFHSLKTALPSFECGDSPSIPVVCAVEALGGGSFAFSEKNKAINTGLTHLDNLYEIKLAVTADDRECKLEEAVLLELSLSQDPSVDVGKGIPFKTSSHMNPFCVTDNSSGTLKYRDFQRNKENIVLPYCFSSLSCENDDSRVEELPLWWSLIEGLIEVLTVSLSSSSLLLHEPCITFLNLVTGKTINKCLERELSECFSEENIIRYLEAFRKECLDKFLFDSDENKKATLEEIFASQQQLKNALIKCFPGKFWSMFDANAQNRTVSLIVDSLQHPALLEDFSLHILDFISVHLLTLNPH